MGTPEFAVPALKQLVAQGFEIPAVYTRPPAPAGRGKKEQKSPVHILAESHGLPVLTPVSLKNPDEQQKFREFNADLALVAAYGLLLPEPILNGMKFGCINIHPSLLPRWRGAAPIQRAIIAGDSETGVCIMKMDKGLDTGDVLAMEKYKIPEKMTAGELHDALAEIGAGLTLETIGKLAEITPVKQSAEGVTYASKIGKEDEKIDWRKSAREIECLVRGLQPRPGAYFIHNGERIKITAADFSLGGAGKPAGTVLDENFSIACGTGVLRPLKLQRPGKNIVSLREFLNVFPAKPGQNIE